MDQQSGPRPSAAAIIFDTRIPEGRKAILSSLDGLVHGEAIEQANAGVRMAVAMHRKHQGLATRGLLPAFLMTPAQTRDRVRRKIAFARNLRSRIGAR